MDLWPLLAGGAVALFAISASVHVILNKREVGTAVAWVGLIWLSPLIGAILYSVLGINRIRRRATALRADTPAYRDLLPQQACPPETLARRLGPDREHLADVARLGDRVTERPLLAGNRITPLHNGDEAYPAMLETIDAAERSVTLCSYIFDNDRAGRLFANALRDAVRRGVEVRVLIDDVGARYSFPSMFLTLRRYAVRVARFMPALLHWRMPYFNLRSHRKIMVVDGRVGFTGGMNIREGFWHDVVEEPHGQDLHFRIEGPVVAELQEAFAEDWTFTTGERLRGNLWFPPLESGGPSVARGISDGPDIDYEKLKTMILGALGAARHSVRIVTPYFIPDAALISGLTLTAMRGVDVHIVLPEKGNLALVQWASTAYWSQLLERGCRIFLSGPTFDHSKLMVVDDAWTLLGSANLDPRSLQLNFEFNVEVYDPDLAREMSAFVDGRIDTGREVSLLEVRGRSLPHKLRDGVARLASPYL